MRSVLDRIVERLFDYAGTFPPASKSFDDALETSSEFERSLARPWLVAADFVLPIGDLERLPLDRLDDLGFGSFRCAVLGAPFEGSTDRVREEWSRLDTFNAESPNRQAISYEVRIADGADLRPLIVLLNEADSRLFCALEPDLSTAEWEKNLANVTAALTEVRGHAALKVRGGGPTAIDHRKLAAAIVAVAEWQIDLKATAGMHHPILEERYRNDLGFLNTVTALLLRRRPGSTFSVEEVERCLTTSDPSLYTVGAELFSWDGWDLSASEIAAQKERYRFTIGSCSLHEPDADLVRLFGAPTDET